ncbi:hypothetical protein B0O99DRAFT_287982 [Bisporella sp. PMI_857]|nr:hypothetical protein B0O99DRAFT_287982 [Bisporella sp. PMI_857]
MTGMHFKAGHEMESPRADERLSSSDVPLDLGKESRSIEKVVPPKPNILPNNSAYGDQYEIGDAYEGWERRKVWAIPDEDAKPYLKYVKRISEGFPHLRWLADFMEVSTMPSKWKFLTSSQISDRAKRTRVAMLDLSPSSSTRLDIQNSEKLNQLISDPNFNHNPEHARIFILEDLSRDMVEVFGAAYDIDPLFFRGHLLDYLWYNIRDPWVDLPDLEGVVQGRNFFNIRYMIPKYFQSQDSIEQAVEQLGGWNVIRRIEQELSWKIRLKRKIKDSTVGVIRGKASLWIRRNKEGESGLLAILVMDPTLREGFPLWGGPRALAATPSMHSPLPPPRPSPTSNFERLISSTLSLPSPLLTHLPSQPLTLALPILSLIAGEWLSVVTYITTTLTKIEYELEDVQYRESSTGLTGSLDRLHPLRRLMPVYRSMVVEVLSTLLNPDLPPPSAPSSHIPTTDQTPNDNGKRMLKNLHNDFNNILTSLDALQTRTQNIISLATTIISIEENQRAMKMNVNLVRVTYLAVIFVPMAFVSSFLSMTPDLSAIRDTVGVYFAVAVPLTVLCVAAADPRGVRRVWRWAVGRSGRGGG